jgi:hypothetical protein
MAKDTTGSDRIGSDRIGSSDRVIGVMKAERSRRPAGSLRAIGSAGLLGLLIFAGASVPWTAHQPAAQAVMQPSSPPPSTPAIPEIASLFSDANEARANTTAAAAILGLTQHQVGLVFSAVAQLDPVAAGDMITLSGPCGDAVLDVSMTEEITPPTALPAGVEDIKLVSGILRTAQGQVYVLMSSARVASCSSNGDPRLVFGFIGHSTDGPTMSAAQQNYANANQAHLLADAGGPQPTPTPAPNPAPGSGQGGGQTAPPPPQFTPAQYDEVLKACKDDRKARYDLCVTAINNSSTDKKIGFTGAWVVTIAATAACFIVPPVGVVVAAGAAIGSGGYVLKQGQGIMADNRRRELAEHERKYALNCCEQEVAYLRANNLDPRQWRSFTMQQVCVFACP